MNRRVLAFAIAALPFFAFLSCAHYQPAVPSEQMVFYVAPNGNDAWIGTRPSPTPDGLNGPFATLERARDAIRDLKRRGMNRPITVYLRGGTYFLDEPVVFTSQDSGTLFAPVTYEAYPGETPILSGGRRLPALREIEPGVGEVVLPQVRDGEWFFAQLFVDGERRTRARIPNEGFLRMDGAIQLEDPVRFTYREGDINPAWAGRGVEINALSKWAGFRMPIQSVDANARLVTLTKETPPFNWGGTVDARYWIENAPEGLDSPGEWRLDIDSGVLTYLAKQGERLDRLDVIAPVTPQLIILRGEPENGELVRHLTFRGLTFSHTAAYQLDEGYAELQAAHQVPAAFQADGAEECRVEGCRFVSLGGYAVDIRRGCKNNAVVGCYMTDLGAGGVKVGEPAYRQDEYDLTERIAVTDNHTHNIGVIYPAAIGVSVFQSAYNEIAHNLIHDAYYTAISVGWTWGYTASNAHHNRVEFNHAWNIGRGLLSDMGGIYTLGPQMGTVVRNNVFRDIRSYDYGGWGLYTDEGSSYILIENNLSYRCKSAGFHQHYGKENIIRNNVLAFNEENQIMRTRPEEHLSFIFEQNIVLYDQGNLLGSNWSGENFHLNRNLYWREDGEVNFQGASLEEWQSRGQDIDSRVADPMFVDPRRGDFRLRPGSPALEIGFQPIDVSRVGPRDPWRTQSVRRHNRIQ